MVQAIIDISKESNRVLNVIKAKYDLRTKSEAINRMVAEYLDSLPEPPLRPEYVRKMRTRLKEPVIQVGTVENLHRLIMNPRLCSKFPIRSRKN